MLSSHGRGKILRRGGKNTQNSTKKIFMTQITTLLAWWPGRQRLGLGFPMCQSRGARLLPSKPPAQSWRDPDACHGHAL